MIYANYNIKNVKIMIYVMLITIILVVQNIIIVRTVHIMVSVVNTVKCSSLLHILIKKIEFLQI
jgi:hypothetical protein